MLRWVKRHNIIIHTQIVFKSARNYTYAYLSRAFLKSHPILMVMSQSSNLKFMNRKPMSRFKLEKQEYLNSEVVRCLQLKFRILVPYICYSQ